jgi:hypothetical protein
MPSPSTSAKKARRSKAPRSPLASIVAILLRFVLVVILPSAGLVIVLA